MLFSEPAAGHYIEAELKSQTDETMKVMQDFPLGTPEGDAAMAAMDAAKDKATAARAAAEEEAAAKERVDAEVRQAEEAPRLNTD